MEYKLGYHEGDLRVPANPGRLELRGWGWGQFSSDGWVNFLAMSAEDAEEKLLREMAL